MSDLAPPEGDPGQLTHCTGTLGTVATDAGKQKTAVQKGVATAIDAWRGPRRDEFARAGAGLQVELDMLQTSAQKVAGLVHEYGLALKKTQDDIEGWAREVHHAEQAMGDDPAAASRAEHVRAQMSGYARQATHQLKQLAAQIAGEIDAETALLVPKGDHLSPDAIRRRVLTEYGVAGLGGHLTPAQAWRALKSAESAVPAEVVKDDGEVDWRKLLSLGYWLPHINKYAPDASKSALDNATSIVTSDEFAAFPIGLSVELLRRYRKTQLVLPKTAAAEDTFKALAPVLADNEDPFTLTRGIWVPKGSSADPLVGQINDTVEHGEYTKPQKPLLASDPDVLPTEIPGWARYGGRALVVAGAGLSIYGAGAQQWTYDEDHHPDWSDTHKKVDTAQTAAVVGGGTALGAWGGAELGAEWGAAAGSFIGPEGTVIGGIVGGVVGGFAGSKVGHVAGDVAESVGHSVAHGVSSAWHSVFG